MGNVLLARGAKGEIVKMVQRRLEQAGFSPNGIDGVFGKDTENAVSGFQQDRGLERTGEVNLQTWNMLMGTSPPSVRDRSLQLTATFEGHDFTLAQGNFDGAGITWGIIGFTLKHGELGKIILEIEDRNPEFVRQAFKDRTDELLGVLQLPMSKQLKFADSISLGTNKVRLAEPWRKAFAAFGGIPEVQALQLNLADHDYFQPGVKTAGEFDLKSELGISLTFDIHVQNGGVKASARQQIERDLSEHPVASEQELRVIIANAVADKASLEFREDVRSRKLAIATGSGKVHGAMFVLRNWGLDETPF
jgi:Putative peptidoglycan binding domain/Glycosyl hydrolase family 46